MLKWDVGLAKLSLLIGLFVSSAMANAHDDQWSIGIAIGNPYPPAVRYYAPPPAYYLPPAAYYAPPPVVYRHPQSRYYSVPNAVYQPAFPSAIPYYGGGYNHRDDQRRQGRHYRRNEEHHERHDARGWDRDHDH